MTLMGHWRVQEKNWLATKRDLLGVIRVVGGIYTHYRCRCELLET